VQPKSAGLNRVVELTSLNAPSVLCLRCLLRRQDGGGMMGSACVSATTVLPAFSV
jgi:hypothetical protein